jgi:LAS superfamily LD-carboxypeptidase LdcB
MLASADILSGADESHLIQRDDGHKLQVEVSQAVDQMQKAAFKDGIDLQIVSSFRSLDKQLSIWNAKWRGERTLYSLDGAVLDPNQLGETEKLNAILTWSALPGSSRHHWGTDLDVMDKRSVLEWGKPFELVPEEYNKGGPCYDLSCWLKSNAQKFEFVFPYSTYSGGVAAEPWHLSYAPLSSVLSQHMTYDFLHQLIKSLDIEGKNMILRTLPAIIARFVVKDKH